MYANFSTDQVFAPLIKVIYFENLHITDIIMLNLLLVSGNISIKSSVKVKKRIVKDFISYKNL